MGCADGTREGFAALDMFPRIAGCAGGWSVQGMTDVPSCDHASGNSTTNPDGVGCSSADLCTANFHVCTSANDVASRSPSGCDGASVGEPAPSFFATLQTGPGLATCSGADGSVCDAPGSPFNCDGSCHNDLFGCGDLGNPPDPSCGVLDATSGNLCGALGAPWVCPSVGGPAGDPYSAGCSEFISVTKLGPEAGGVLCCAN